MVLARFSASACCLLIAVAAPGALASTANDVKELVKVETTNERRDALVDALSSAPFREVTPKILPLIREYATPREPGMSPKPWMVDGHSVRARTWYALGAIWSSQIGGGPDPAKSAVLLSMLGASDPGDKHQLIQAIGLHWTAGSERPLVGLLESRSEPPDVRLAAATMLLRHASIDRYVPSAVALVREMDPSRRRDAYDTLTNLGDAVRSARPESRVALVNLGFELLEAGDVAAGYFLARRLGFLLDVPREFAPDQHAPQYKGPNGLTQEFFDDTVRNARAWRAAHQP